MRDWRVSVTGAVVVFMTPLVIFAVAAALRVFAEPTSLKLSAEDGVIEWMQAISFGVATIFAAMIAVQLAGQRRWFVAVLYAGLAVALLFIVGEELSWGQRFLGFETPEGLAAVNEKGETSVHNIPTVERFFILGKWIAGIYGTFGFLLLWWLRRRGSASWLQLCLVPLFLSSAFALILGLKVIDATVLAGRTPVDYGEYDELFLGLGLALFAVFTWRRLREPEAGVQLAHA